MSSGRLRLLGYQQSRRARSAKAISAGRLRLGRENVKAVSSLRGSEAGKGSLTAKGYDAEDRLRATTAARLVRSSAPAARSDGTPLLPPRPRSASVASAVMKKAVSDKPVRCYARNASPA